MSRDMSPWSYLLLGVLLCLPAPMAIGCGGRNATAARPATSAIAPAPAQVLVPSVPKVDWPKDVSGLPAPVVPAPQPAQMQTRTATSSGKAPCTIADGYQTVRFSNGGVYSGSFKDCRPLSGPARFQQGAITLSGHAEPVDDHTVTLRTATHQATITLEIQPVSYGVGR